jgi:phosphoserine phosphatase
MPDYKPLNVAVFDLNLTVYNKSSKEEFFRFICRKRKEKALHILGMSLYTLGKKLGLLNKTTFKENFFHYLDHIPPETLEAYAREFWAQEWPQQFNRQLLERIENLRQEGTAIYFATGGLDCYVKPLFEEFLRPDAWLGTRTQYINGRYKIIGKACKADEKIKRVNQLIHPRPYQITEAYSDKNEAIMQVAKQAFLIKEGEIQRLST